MSSVTISNVRKSYGNVLALSDISIDIEAGSFYTLLGPSGCGKTTLLRTIAGFHYQDSGTISIAGKQIQNLPAHRRNVGMVFQDYAVFPHLSVRDNVAFGLKQRKVKADILKPRVTEALRMVQLESFAERMPHELSGGQQQRVGLARAFAVDPNVMLMDEPLSNLDAKLRVDLRGELRRIQQDLGMTTIYVTHDQEEALAMSDTVCVMYQGIIQQAATPFEIYKNPANRFVANFVGANNFLKADKTDTGAVRLGGNIIADNIDLTGVSGVIAAVRPEDVSVQPEGTQPVGDNVTIEGTVRQISFIGREVEIHGVDALGEVVKATVRPTPEILRLNSGDKIAFSFARSDIHLFEDTDTGRRLT